MWKWITNPVPKFHKDPTVKKSKIIVLLGQVLGLYGKRENYNTKEVSLSSKIVSQITMVRMFGNKFWTWCSNFTTIQRLTSPRLLFYWDRFECIREKERVLGGGEEKTKLRGRETAETTVSLKKWPNMSLFIARYS